LNLTVVGTGYVGLVTGTCLAEGGHQVTCLDVDHSKITRLRAGEIPIHEPGLEELVHGNTRAGRLHFTTRQEDCVPSARAVFLAVGTPQGDDGAANLEFLWRALADLAPHLSRDAVVIIKSTVPVGTNRQAANWLRQLLGRDVPVVSNPEFLREGSALQDFTQPDRVVVGCDSPAVAEILREIYLPYLEGDRPFLVMDLESSEMTKYVANCLLATKISFINEMAGLCERTGADINQVRQGIGHDARIGFAFLAPGAGYGGSCFPKDVRATMALARSRGADARLLLAVDEVNNHQKRWLGTNVVRELGGDLSGRTVAVWGLAFKPGTDDIREAPALVLIDTLLGLGAQVGVHDPVAMPNVRALYGDRLIYRDNPYETLDGAEALAIVTDWADYKSPDFPQMRSRMSRPLIIDGRNLYEPALPRTAGFQYISVGR